VRPRSLVLCLTCIAGAIAACSDDSATRNDTGPAREAGALREGGGAGEAGSCDLAAAWTGTIPGGTFAGQNLVWSLSPGGTWVATIAKGTINGTWQLSGSTFKVKDVSATPAYLACAATDEGAYALAFSADCKKVSLKLTSDPCDGRKAYLDGLSATRQ
jgi:hypothetical protein